jgi:hypothetical protein
MCATCGCMGNMKKAPAKKAAVKKAAPAYKKSAPAYKKPSMNRKKGM